MHKIGGKHLLCANNHYAKFEYNGMNTVGVSDYTNCEKFSFLYIQNLPIDYSHIEDVHLLFCAHFIFFHPKCLGVA